MIFTNIFLQYSKKGSWFYSYIAQLYLVHNSILTNVTLPVLSRKKFFSFQVRKRPKETGGPNAAQLATNAHIKSSSVGRLSSNAIKFQLLHSMD